MLDAAKAMKLSSKDLLDLAIIDEDGYFLITGRKKRFIKLFGNIISLDDVEEFLQKQNIKDELYTRQVSEVKEMKQSQLFPNMKSLLQ